MASTGNDCERFSNGPFLEMVSSTIGAGIFAMANRSSPVSIVRCDPFLAPDLRLTHSSRDYRADTDYLLHNPGRALRGGILWRRNNAVDAVGNRACSRLVL